MKTPILMINLKTYSEASSAKAEGLADVCAEVAKDAGKSIALCAQAADIRMLADKGIPVLAQHVDDIKPGSHTGFILAEDVKQAGAVGTLLNHSEHRLEKDVLERCVERAREAGLIIVICAKDADEAEGLAKLKPEFLAVEPPELIGGDISVSTAQPELIKESVERIKAVDKDVKVLVGAGVKDADDVKIALDLGAEGVLVASGVVKAEDQREAVKDLAKNI